MNYPFPTNTPILYVRAIIFFLGYAFLTFIFSIFCLCFGWILPFNSRQDLISLWCKCTLAWINITCNISYQIEGLHNIPQTPCVIVSKHSSAWETIILQCLFTPLTTVLKKELLKIPGFGWGLALLEPIAIDRSKKHHSLKIILQQGQEKLKQGRWVLVFPEGTRYLPGEPSTFSAGGAMLAKKANVQILPITHNAGCFWPKDRLVKYPGVITLSFGPVINSEEDTTKSLNTTATKWIEEETKRLVKYTND